MMAQSSDFARTLFCGDNLHILHTQLASESVDLIYLDPPFSSQRNYQAFFKKSLSAQDSQKAPAFIDVWRWNASVEQSYQALLKQAPEHVILVMTALRTLLKVGPFL